MLRTTTTMGVFLLGLVPVGVVPLGVVVSVTDFVAMTVSVTRVYACVARSATHRTVAV